MNIRNIGSSFADTGNQSHLKMAPCSGLESEVTAATFSRPVGIPAVKVDFVACFLVSFAETL